MSFVEKMHRWYKKSIEKPFPILNSILIGTAVVLYWRGMWGVIDLYLYPQNPSVSYIISMVMGIVFLIMHHGLTKISELE